MVTFVPNLLVLEDSVTQAKMIERMFKNEGAQAVSVNSYRDFTSDPHLFDLKFDAVLIDVHFGEVSGLALIEQISRRWPLATLVMMTANRTDDFSVLARARKKGAHVVLRKPFTRKEVMETLLDIRAVHATGERRKHVVIIDDSKTSCRIFSTALRGQGYRVSTYQSGEDAIQKLNYDHVDVVLTDMHMPGMSGAEMICLVRDVWRDVGIVAMSSDEGSGKFVDGADAFILKPFKSEELADVISSVMNSAQEELEC